MAGNGFYRVVNLANNDRRPVVFVWFERPIRKHLDVGKADAPRGKPDPPDRDQNQAADDDGGGRRGVVPVNDPGVKGGVVIEQKVQQWIVAGQGEWPVDEAPCGASTAQPKIRIG